MGVLLFIVVNFIWQLRDYYHQKTKRLQKQVKENKRNEEDLKNKLEDLQNQLIEKDKKIEQMQVKIVPAQEEIKQDLQPNIHVCLNCNKKRLPDWLTIKKSEGDQHECDCE